MDGKGVSVFSKAARSLVDASALEMVARTGERARTEEDEVVGTGTEDDVLGLDAGVVGDRVEQVWVTAVRVLVHARQSRRHARRTRRSARPRRNVAVEAHDVDWVQTDAEGELFRRRRPLIGGERGWQCPHLRIASACAGIPSTAASASTTGRMLARPARVSR